jgi:hypothetical protein
VPFAERWLQKSSYELDARPVHWKKLGVRIPSNFVLTTNPDTVETTTVFLLFSSQPCFALYIFYPDLAALALANIC